MDRTGMNPLKCCFYDLLYGLLKSYFSSYIYAFNQTLHP